MDYQVTNSESEKTDRIMENIAFIEEKLQNSNMPDGKRDKLEFQKKHLQKVVLPRCCRKFLQ